MKVKIKLFGSVASCFNGYDSELGIELDIPHGAKVQDLLVRLQIPESEAGIILANGLTMRFDSQIEEGMSVYIFPFVSGG